MSNAQFASRIVALVRAFGTTEVVVCGGSRNSPLITALAAAPLTLHPFPEERSAGFFALGRSQRSRAPVAVVTTSGTAAAELLPAAIEAHYSGVPLILITADRPRRFRGTGAPQSIEQAGLFGPYAHPSIDAQSASDHALPDWAMDGPIHINAAFDEPLIDGDPQVAAIPQWSPTPPGFTSAAAGEIETFLDSATSPVVIVSSLQPGERQAVREFVRKLGAPTYAEPLSGLREDPALQEISITAGERMLASGEIDAVLRIGGVPAIRYWRDLEETRTGIAVLSISALPFSGLSRGKHLQADLAQVMPAVAIRKRRDASALLQRDRSMAARIHELMGSMPRSEMGMMRKLSTLVGERSLVYLGNSLPIREWDLAAIRTSRSIEYAANRGANGIDGQISTFFGRLEPDREGWCVIGDLTALYDLAAPWSLRLLEKASRFRIVVVNNKGGRIFSRVRSLSPIDPATRRTLIENEHDLNFEAFAAMWGLPYQRWHEIRPSSPAEPRMILELTPDPGESERFWQSYDRLW